MCNITTDEELELKALIQLINATLNNNNVSNQSVNLVSSLWIILFSLIIIQKVFKYIVKPCYIQRTTGNNENKNNNNNINRDPSAECMLA